MLGTAHLEFTFDGHRQELEFQLQDIEPVFWVGDMIQVIVGAYTGLEGHIIRKSKDFFHICQEATNEELPMQPDSNPLPEPKSLQIRDKIEVGAGEYMGKCGIVEWLPKGEMLWFWAGSGIKDQLVHVPVAFVKRIWSSKTLQFTKERGYDVKPGDVVIVACGPEFQTKGVVRIGDFPNARLTLISEGNHSLIDVPIGFIMKVSNMNLDLFHDIIGKEVFIIGGAQKGYQAMLYQLTQDACFISLHGQVRTTAKHTDVATSAMLKGLDMITFCDMRRKSYLTLQCRSKTPPPSDPIVPSSTNPNSSKWSNWSGSNLDSTDNLSSFKAYDPWVANNAKDIEDTIAERAEKLQNDNPLPWLMNKEFMLKLTQYHVLFKVLPRFMGGKLHNHSVLTACPDPFCGDNGPAPNGCVMCLILDGDAHSQILTITKCNMKKNSIEIAMTTRTSFTMWFNQICLVEERR
ncbi:hypothetical protein EV702DRAFT_1051013 [Suillus placidus]|uniref:Uncharacterized protein n=1 Tax=Suillus placidus TaxID=48579 RepID=A0A9P6ZGN6_9AGAM|nr:hypothetical protein EV702DRAFT_1051013 [Suillus placidus]